MFLQTFARKKLPIKENLLFFETQISFFQVFFFILKSLQIYYFPSYPPIEKGYLLKYLLFEIKPKQSSIFSPFFVK